MKDTTFRICNAAIGRIFIKLIETAEGADWDFAQLGRNITALKGAMTNADYTSDLDLDRMTYHTLCEQVNLSESRSQRARERWQRKKGRNVEPTTDIPAEKAVKSIIVAAEPVEVVEKPAGSPVENEPDIPETEETVADGEETEPEAVENNVGQGHIVPSGLKWSETIAVVNGRVKLPKKRPIYCIDVPPHLRAIGVESYEEYIRHKLYDEGVRGNDLENKVCLYTDRMVVSRRNEAAR